MTRALAALVPLAALLLGACERQEPAADPAAAADSTTPGAAAPAPAHAWRSNPAQGVAVTPGPGGALTVETGPHAVVWEEGGPDLAPPYAVRATLHKLHGRLHEGFGIVFGASGLDRPEAEQRYSYFLVRGDGSFLVKRRDGAATPVVRDWTRHPAIRRDAEDGGRPNPLEVRVSETDVAFLVDGVEVARVPAAELSVRGRAGLRTSHDLRLEVSGFGAVAGALPADAPP